MFVKPMKKNSYRFWLSNCSFTSISMKFNLLPSLNSIKLYKVFLIPFIRSYWTGLSKFFLRHCLLNCLISSIFFRFTKHKINIINCWIFANHSSIDRSVSDMTRKNLLIKIWFKITWLFLNPILMMKFYLNQS